MFKPGMDGKQMRPAAQAMLNKKHKLSPSTRKNLDNRIDNVLGVKDKKRKSASGKPMKGPSGWTSGKMCKKTKKNKATGPVKHTGSFEGKSNRLGQGGRAAQLRARGVPGGVIGAIARREQAAPGQKNYHKKKKNKK